MSLAALNGSAGTAQPPLERPRDMATHSADGGAFDAIMNTLPGGRQTNARGAALSDAASAKDQESPGDGAAKSQSDESIDSGLAGLVFDALGSPRRGARESAADASSVSASAPLAISAAVAALQAIQPATLAAEPASAAAKLKSASTLAVGALDAPETIHPLTLSDPALGLTSLQTRTFLAVDNAGQTAAKDPFLRSPTLAATGAAVWGTLGAGSASGTGDAATGKRSGSSQSGASPAQAASSAARLASGAVAAAGAAQNGASSEKRSGSGGSGSQAAASAGSTPPAMAAANALTVGNPAVIEIGPIATGQLAETLATAAQELVSQTAGATGPDPAATNIAAAQPVKELEIKLDPTDLGAVSVKMRLSGGKLSVVMEIAKSTTLQAVEGERGAIAERLGSAAQPLESLVIRPATTNSANPGNTDARDQKSGGGTDGQGGANGNFQSDGRQASRRDPPAQEHHQGPTQAPVSGRGFGGMVV